MLALHFNQQCANNTSLRSLVWNKVRPLNLISATSAIHALCARQDDASRHVFACAWSRLSRAFSWDFPLAFSGLSETRARFRCRVCYERVRRRRKSASLELGRRGLRQAITVRLSAAGYLGVCARGTREYSELFLLLICFGFSSRFDVSEGLPGGLLTFSRGKNCSEGS